MSVCNLISREKKNKKKEKNERNNRKKAKTACTQWMVVARWRERGTRRSYLGYVLKNQPIKRQANHNANDFWHFAIRKKFCFFFIFLFPTVFSLSVGFSLSWFWKQFKYIKFGSMARKMVIFPFFLSLKFLFSVKMAQEQGKRNFKLWITFKRFVFWYRLHLYLNLSFINILILSFW